MAFLGLLAASLVFGVASGLIPVINAEAYLATTAGVAALPTAISVALVVAVGQTIGKVIIFLAARRGASLRLPRWGRRPRAQGAPPRGERALGTSAPAASVAPTAGPSGQSRGVRARLAALGRRGLALLDRPWLGGGVILTSAAVGVPPLAVTTVAAGLSRMRLALFTVTVLVGRTGWFLLVTFASDRLVGGLFGG